jgi:WD40 repeat protein
VRIWDLKTGKVLRSWKPPKTTGWAYLHTVAFSPDGKRLAVAAAAYECELFVHDTETGKLIWQKRTLGASHICLAFSPDGKRLVCTGDFSDRKNHDLNVFRAEDGKLERGFYSPKTPALSEEVPITFAPDGKTVVANSAAGRVTLWDIETGKAQPEVHIDPEHLEISSLAMSPDGKVLAVGTRKSLFLFDLKDGKRLRVLSERKKALVDWRKGEPLLIRFSPDGKTVLAFLDHKLQAWDVKTGKARKVPDVAWSEAAAFSADRSSVASGFKITTIPK